MHGVRSVVVIRGLVVGLIAVAFAGCGGSGGGDESTPGTFHPAAAAAAVRALGAIAVTGHAAVPGHRVGLGGRIQYRPARVLLQVPVSSERYLAAVQYRRIGRNAWVRRSVVTTPGVMSFGVPLLAFRSSAQAPFVVLDHPDEGAAFRIAAPYDPARLLDALARERTVHFRATPALLGADPEFAGFRADLPPAVRTRLGLSTVRVGVDRRSVPISVRLTTPYGLTSEYRLEHPKVQSVAVSSPPSTQVEASGRPLPDAVEAYSDVLTTTGGRVPVTIRRAAGRDGWTCFRVESVPPYATMQSARPSGGVCVPPASDAVSDQDQIALPIDADATTPYELIGAIVPSGSVVTVELLDGHSVVVPAGASGLAVYAGGAVAPAVLMTVVVPGGASVLCAPGALNGANDLAQVGAADVVRAAPWNCLPKELADLVAG